MCCGNRIIPRTTTMAAKSSIRPTIRGFHTTSRGAVLLPKSHPSRATDRPSSHGRNEVKNALAAPAPSAVAKPSGRQQLREASELRIAPAEAEIPLPSFTDSPLSARRALPAGSFLPVAHPTRSSPDTTGRPRQSFEHFPIPLRRRDR
jgi:hypothetical protein